MKYVITIGREFGSGGRYIGKLVAEKLGINFYDNELLEKASQESGINEAVFKTFDERKESLLGAGIGTYRYDMSLSQKVFLAEFDAIRKIASQESCVIVGRCADYVLEGYKNVINIFVCASDDDKIDRAVKYYGFDPEKAGNQITKINKKRKNYYNFYTDKVWGRASNYDLCINSGIGLEESVNIIIDYAVMKLKIKNPINK